MRLHIICLAILITAAANVARAETRAFPHSPEELAKQSTLIFLGIVLTTSSNKQFAITFPTSAAVTKVLKGRLRSKEITFQHKTPDGFVIFEEEFNTPEVGQRRTFYLVTQGGILVLIGYHAEAKAKKGAGYNLLPFRSSLVDELQIHSQSFVGLPGVIMPS